MFLLGSQVLAAQTVSLQNSLDEGLGGDLVGPVAPVADAAVGSLCQAQGQFLGLQVDLLHGQGQTHGVSELLELLQLLPVLVQSHQDQDAVGDQLAVGVVLSALGSHGSGIVEGVSGGSVEEELLAAVGGDGHVGDSSWNKGLTSETDERVKNNSLKSQNTKIEKYGNKYGKQNVHLTEEHKRKIKEANKNQKPTEYCKLVSSLRNKGTHYYNNGIVERKFKDDEIIPISFVKGRLINPFPNQTGKKKSKETIEKIKKSKSNIFWINNGEIEKMIKIDSIIPDGFVKGRIKPMNNS